MEFQQALERAAPAGWGQERQKAFEHQDQRERGPEDVGVQGPPRPYFFAAGAGPLLLRNALKNSEPLGSTTSTSAFLLKLDLYASRLR